jgi:hypothetical protein
MEKLANEDKLNCFCRLLGLCGRHFGSVAANTVRAFKPEELPLLLIISRNRGISEVVQVLHGKFLFSFCLGGL